MQKINVTDLLDEVQQIKIMGGERDNSQIKFYLGHCHAFADCNKFCHFD